MKIGIMGGTFYPIHNGHIALAEFAMQQYGLDQIWFMPNRIPPHKSNALIEEMTKHRIQMVKLAIHENDSFVFQPYEVENAEVSYSYKTMEHFKALYPEYEFYFIIGADSLFSLEKWVCPEKLLKTCVILAAFRDGKSTQEMEEQIIRLKGKYQCDIRILNTPYIDISSTEIRYALKNKQSISDMVPKRVSEYIDKHKLFQEDLYES